MNPRSGLIAEFLGTALLLMAVVGSGVMGAQLSQGNDATALMANAMATGLALWVLITVIAPISGAHFNPLVTLTLAATRRWPWAQVPGYVIAQFVGAIAGVLLTHALFDLPLLQIASKTRSGLHLSLSEMVATGALLGLILLGLKQKTAQLPALIAAYITAAYWFTSSSVFANPAVTVARALTDTFCGIAPADVLPYLAAQCLGASLVIGIVVMGAGKYSKTATRPLPDTLQ